MALDVEAIRRQFPILATNVGGSLLTYLDSAATAQKPDMVLEAMDRYYRSANANVHRGMHPLAEAATEHYEGVRSTVREFLDAKHDDEIVFTKSCTEAINLVAKSWGSSLAKGDAVILTMLEHHSNVVPWLQLKETRGIELRWVDIEDDGTLRVEDLERHLADGKAKLVATTALSNVLGVRPPMREIIPMAHTHGALVLVDAAQSVAHEKIDVQAWDCDFLAFSGHKLYGPTGIGVLYGKRELLKLMPPMLGGGMMIHEVTTDSFTPADPPARFEGGTPAIAEAIGLGAAIEWIKQFSWDDIAAHEQDLLGAARRSLSTIRGMRVLGPEQTTGCLGFVMDGLHPHDLTEMLGREGICLRAGHHCAEPLHRRLGIPASTRLSVGIYNTLNDIERVAPAIERASHTLLG